MRPSRSTCKRCLYRGYFHCCYLPFHRRKILCLFLTMVVLATLMMTSQTLTHNGLEYSIRWSPGLPLRATNNSDGHEPVKQNNEPVKHNSKPIKQTNEPIKQNNEPVKQNNEPVKQNNKPVKQNNKPVKQNNQSQTEKDGEQAVPVNISKTKNISVAQVRTLKSDPKIEGKENSHREDKPGEMLQQNNQDAKPLDKGSEFTSRKKNTVKTKVDPPQNVLQDKIKQEDEHQKGDPETRIHDPLGKHRVSRQYVKNKRERAQRMKHGEIMEQIMLSLFEENGDLMKGEVENTNGETRHVFFLKVHKAASTTVMNVMYRFAIKRHLSVMLPLRGNVLSEGIRSWRRFALPLPRDATHFDMLCNHVVFSEPIIRASLGQNAKFIGIVREPFHQFLSAFFYYRQRFRLRYLSRILGVDPVATYLQNPVRYEARTGANSYTHNRMSFDFGMNPRIMNYPSSVDSYIHYLNKTFDLVMISERFDESMVLMKRLLGWRLQDILYIRNNVFMKENNNYTAEQKLAHRNFNMADYALYEHFAQLFQTKVENEGKLFVEEVATFVALREKVEQFCQKPEAEHMSLPPTDWTPEFGVSPTDCQLMVLHEVPFVNVMKSRQYSIRNRHMK